LIFRFSLCYDYIYILLIYNNRLYLEHWVSGKSWDRSWDVVGGDEGHDGNHGKTSVVELTVLLEGHGLGRNTGEIDWWEDDGWEGTSLGVMVTLGFGDELGNEDGEEDLGLSSSWYGLPGIEGLHGGEGLEGDIGGQLSREVDSGSLDDVSCGGEHGHTGVLELGGTEPKKGLIGSGSGESDRIEGREGGGGAGEVLEGVEGCGGGGLSECE